MIVPASEIIPTMMATPTGAARTIEWCHDTRVPTTDEGRTMDENETAVRIKSSVSTIMPCQNKYRYDTSLQMYCSGLSLSSS